MRKMLKMIQGLAASTVTATLATGVAQAQSTWDAVQERGTLRIGVIQAPPWFTKDIRTGEWTGGLGMTLGKKMAEAFEVELGPVEVTWGTSIDQFLTRMAPDADIQRFPDNAASFAAFQSGRVDAVSLTLAPLLSARQKPGSGVISVPTPAFAAPVNIGARREAEKTRRDRLDTTSLHWYETGRIQGWHDAFLVEFGVDPKDSPPIRRELIFMR